MVIPSARLYIFMLDLLTMTHFQGHKTIKKERKKNNHIFISVSWLNFLVLLLPSNEQWHDKHSSIDR